VVLSLINCGGGDLVAEVAWATDDESALDLEQEVKVACDGVLKSVPPPGDSVALSPSESIALPPKLCTALPERERFT
jgi:D-lyxose ketol-isomerase